MGKNPVTTQPLPETETKLVGISPAFLTFFSEVGARVGIEPSEWRRCYEHFEHAELRLKTVSAKHDRIDIVAALKRAIDVRVAFLAKLYGLKNAPGMRKATRFEALTRLGLIRPIMSKELFDVRGAVEHLDADPPSTADCRRYTEFTWYFLRATDAAAEHPAVSLQFAFEFEGGANYWATVSREAPAAWNFTLAGWFPDEDLHAEPNAEDVIVRVERIETARDAKDRGIGPMHGAHDQNDSDTWLAGSIEQPSPIDERLVALFVTA